MGIPYFERDTRRFTCGECSWTGPGSELEIYQLYDEVVEWACPNCGEKVGYSGFPNREEAQAAAGAGSREALDELPRFNQRERRSRRVFETRGTDIAAPAELDHGDVRCVLYLLDDARGETWLTLTANGLEIHRELAVWEDIEPARRLLGLMRQRYGGRLRSFDYNPAFLYLCGDKLSAVSELRRVVAGLPEGDGTSSGGERRAD